MNAREKGDIYWRKRKRYLAAAAVRNGLKEGYFNPDMAEDVLERYKEIKSADKRIFLTGNEFEERPPTAVGRRAFADAVASLMKERDRFERLINDLPGDDNSSENQILMGGLEEIVAAIEQVLGDYFTASGLTQDGEKISDKAERRRAIEAFEKSSELYHMLLDRNNKELAVRFVSELRSKYGLEEQMDAPKPGPGPVFSMLTENYPDVVEKNKELIEKLESINESSRHEAARIVKAREALKEKVTAEYFDEGTEKGRKAILDKTFSQYSFYIDEQLGELLYVQEATAAYAGWVLFSAPVDPILEQYISPEWGPKAEVMDPKMKLSDQEEFIHLKEYDREAEVGEVNSIADVRQKALEIRKYLYAHPWQFDAQCITTISRGTKALPGIVADAKAIRNGLDRLTEKGYLKGLSMEEGIELYETWILVDNITRVGYAVMDFTIGHEDSTLKEAAEDLKKMLPYMSYSKQERICKDAVRQLIAARS